jgi:site-specific DNA-methyltransferase (adenine-specific)
LSLWDAPAKAVEVLEQTRPSRLPEGETPFVHFDPEYRSNLDKLKYGNEGARQRGRCSLPQMSDEYIIDCYREAFRVPSGHLAVWSDAFRAFGGYQEPIEDVFERVEGISWDSGLSRNGWRTRRRGGYLINFQKPPKRAKGIWKRKPVIDDHWTERIPLPKSKSLHPHRKPIGLIRALIEATTDPGDVVIDPAAGSFVVMRVALELGREFIGVDLVYREVDS